MISISFVPILLAGIAVVAIEYLWFNSFLLGRFVSGGLHSEGSAPRRFARVVALLLLGMLVAYVMGYFGIAWGVYDWNGALQLGLWCWIGFAAPMIVWMSWQGQLRKRVAFGILAYWLVQFVVVALVIVYATQFLQIS